MWYIHHTPSQVLWGWFAARGGNDFTVAYTIRGDKLIWAVTVRNPEDQYNRKLANATARWRLSNHFYQSNECDWHSGEIALDDIVEVARVELGSHNILFDSAIGSLKFSDLTTAYVSKVVARRVHSIVADRKRG